MRAIRHFDVLRSRVRLEGPRDMLAPIAAAYHRFERRAPSRDATAVVFRPDGSATIRVARRSVPLVESVDPALQLYNQFLTAVLDGIPGHAVLHGASLRAPDGGAVLIAAPSGCGKSSLTLELLTRGFRLLSDDYSPLDLDSSEVSPYPRRVAIVPGGAAPVPEVFARAAARSGAPRLLGKVVLDVGDVLGEKAVSGSPGKLRHVLLLAPGRSDPSPVTWIDFTTVGFAATEFDEALAAIRGVRVESRREEGDVCHWRIRLDPDEMPTIELAPLLERDEVVFMQKTWSETPDFRGPTDALPCTRRDAATMLGREILNRRARSRFMARYHGDVGRMFLELAAALRPAACWRVTAGPLPDTADLVERLVGGG